MNRLSAIYLSVMGIVLAQGTGAISGIVLDEATSQPLPGANVIILDSDLGTATDENGLFLIAKLAVGSYHIKAMMIGYESTTKLNVHVSPDRKTSLIFRLPISAVEMQAVEVTRSFFKAEPNVFNSSRVVDYEEIRSDPGGAYDVQKMMQSLPAVVSGSDQENEIIVRGGSPGENLFVMDGIEIPNPNHFGMQGGGGGPINMLNVAFVDQIELIAGAFPARYGGKVSSVMDIALREGNRNEYHLDMDMNMAGFGLFGEGPLGGDRGSFIVSAKKSYLDLVIQDIGLTAVPRYWSGQTKLIYDLNPTHKLIFNGLLGDDQINIAEGVNTGFREREQVEVKAGRHTWGLGLKSLWNPTLMTYLLAYENSNWWKIDVYKLTTADQRDINYWNHDKEGERALKFDLLKRLNRNLEISSGIQLKQVAVDYDSYLAPQEISRYLYSTPSAPTQPDSLTESEFADLVLPVIAGRDTTYAENASTWIYIAGPDTVRAFTVGVDTSFDAITRLTAQDFLIINGYLSVKYRPIKNLTVLGGVQLYHTPYNDQTSLEPRLGLSWSLNPATTLNLSLGTHHQIPAYALLMEETSGKSLKNKFTRQVVAGVERMFGPEIRAVVEVYRKDYSDIILSNSDTSAYPYDRGGGLNTLGEGYSHGVEFFLQKKLARQLWGTFSYSVYDAKMLDYRHWPEKKYYDWNYDLGQVLTIAGGYKIEFHHKQWFQDLKRKKWWGAVAWLPVMPADEFELGVRYRYMGGKPYTPQKYNHWHGTWEVDPLADLNGDRFPAYSRLDIVFQQRHFMKKSSLTAFIDIQNIFNTDNIWDYRYNADGTRDTILQYKVFPVGGFLWEL